MNTHVVTTLISGAVSEIYCILEKSINCDWCIAFRTNMIVCIDYFVTSIP